MGYWNSLCKYFTHPLLTSECALLSREAVRRSDNLTAELSINTPMSQQNGNPTRYEEKFSDFISLCAKTDTELVVVHHPQVLGDTYEEIVESLNRLADTEKKLVIVPRKDRSPPSVGK